MPFGCCRSADQHVMLIDDGSGSRRKRQTLTTSSSSFNAARLSPHQQQQQQQQLQQPTRKRYNDDDDDDSDYKAVQWMRERSLELNRPTEGEEEQDYDDEPQQQLVRSQESSLQSSKEEEEEDPHKAIPIPDESLSSSSASPSFLNHQSKNQDGSPRDNDSESLGRQQQQQQQQGKKRPRSVAQEQQQQSAELVVVPPLVHDNHNTTQQRYLSAVHMLHNRIKEKSGTLTTAEQYFLNELLLRQHQEALSAGITKTPNNNDDDDNDMLAERLSEIESTIETLDKDPLFAATTTLSPPSPSKTLQTKSFRRHHQRDYAQKVLSAARDTDKQPSPSLLQPQHRDPTNNNNNNNNNLVAIPHQTDTTTQLLPKPHNDSPPIQFPNKKKQQEGQEEETSLIIDHANKQQQQQQQQQQEQQYSNDDDDDAVVVVLDYEHDEDGTPYKLLLGNQLSCSPHRSLILDTARREALRGFLPHVVSEENFWLKFVLTTHGCSLGTLLHSVRASKYTLLCIETDRGTVFGTFTGSPWRVHSPHADTNSNNSGGRWYGTGEAFLFRFVDQSTHLEVYPYTGNDDMVQYCTNNMLAVGGGDWNNPHYQTNLSTTTTTATTTSLVKSPYGKSQPCGIGVLVDADLAGGESNSCATFANPRLSDETEFQIAHLEVWTLTPCTTVQEAEKLELHKLFVETHSRRRR